MLNVFIYIYYRCLFLIQIKTLQNDVKEINDILRILSEEFKHFNIVNIELNISLKNHKSFIPTDALNKIK